MIARVDVASPVKPRLVTEKNVIEHTDRPTIGIDEPDYPIAEIKTPGRIRWQQFLHKRCAIRAQFQPFKRAKCGHHWHVRLPC